MIETALIFWIFKPSISFLVSENKATSEAEIKANNNKNRPIIRVPINKLEVKFDKNTKLGSGSKKLYLVKQY